MWQIKKNTDKNSLLFTSCRFISLGLRGCAAPSRTSNVSLHSLLSRRLEAEAAAVETLGAVIEDEGFESVAEITRVFVVEEEEGGGGGAALSARPSLRRLMVRCRTRGWFKYILLLQLISVLFNCTIL